MPLFFVAVLLPDDLNEKISEWKRYMKQHYGCKVALRSPAHITLVPPFNLKDEQVAALDSSLTYIANKQKTFSIALNGFSAFPQGVIYVRVGKSPELPDLKSMVEEELVSKSFPIKVDERPFVAHVTIANRDIGKADFSDAWAFFKEQKYEASFSADHLALLKNEPEGWRLVKKFDFSGA